MNYPKLKYPRLCRILTYVVVLGCAALPIIAAFAVPIPDAVRVIVVLGSLIGLLIYLGKNFLVLMSMDMALALLACYNTARKQYTLTSGRTADAIRRSILRYGMQCEPGPIQPQPAALRYRFSSPLTIYSRGIERVIAAYEVDLLDLDMYRDIARSAKANSRVLTGRKKAFFLDQKQSRNPLHRVTVVLILTHKIEPNLVGDLYEQVCKQCGNEDEDCMVPCVVDLEHHTCVFNCLRVPYVGYNYAVKNRGIRIIKNRVFGGHLNLRGNEDYIAPVRDESLWDLWKELHHQLIGAERETKRRFEAMDVGEIRMEDQTLYLKWDNRGICQKVDMDAECRIAKVEVVTTWTYPKKQPIGKKTIQKIKSCIADYYAMQGYTVEFVE